MTDFFTIEEYLELHSLVFRDDYPGYKPEVKEIPNGDGKVDTKRYAHVATKYMVTAQQSRALMPFLERAHALAREIASKIDVPWVYMPDLARGALRVLEYGPGDISHLHRDFDLFTLMLYRDQPAYFLTHDPVPGPLRALNEHGHIGELGQAIGMGVATRHEVLPAPVAQHSIVYFAIPPWEATLSSGVTVKDWLNERMARSRTEFKEYR